MAKKKVETVLVTGAAGTVGGYVVPLLAEEGYRVVAADVVGVEWPFEAGEDVVRREGDITDLAFAIDVTGGVDHVIHLAASLDISKGYEELAPINVEAVRYVYEGARARGAKRFIFFSSGSIYRASATPIGEDSPIQPAGAYEKTKVDAEAYLWSRPEGGPGVTVLRPSMIYGPRGRHLGALLGTAIPMMAALRHRVTRVKGGPVSNWVHAEDVARAAVFLLSKPEAVGQAYNVADDTPLAIGDILAVVTEAFGLELGREVAYPRRLISYVAPFFAGRDTFYAAVNVVLDRAWKTIRERHGLVDRLRPIFDRAMFVYGVRDVIFANQKIKDLGFALKHPDLRTSYRAVLKWYQEARYIPTYEKEEESAEKASSGYGFSFDETMAGTYTREGVEKPFAFTVKVHAPSVRDFYRTRTGVMEGRVDAPGLSEGGKLTGTLEIAVLDRRELVYGFDFEGTDGRTYRFDGKKTVRWWRPVSSMTTLPGVIRDEDGADVASAMVYFDLRKDLIAFIRSFSLTRTPTPLPAPEPELVGV